jgi:hypothetical protein
LITPPAFPDDDFVDGGSLKQEIANEQDWASEII